MGKAREVMDRLTRAAAQEHNVEAVKECYTDDALLVTPDAGELRGREKAADYWRPFIEAFPDMTFEPLRTFEAGDTAIDEGWVSGTHSGPMRLPDGHTIDPTGRRVKFRTVDLATVDNGKIKEHHMDFDQLDFMEQLGISPSGKQAS
ncbi:MAG: ester cyclase [Micromonosporaceae bacterium]|nr:nuclear transport factor 2 family protein [Natronosporangium sp.]